MNQDYYNIVKDILENEEFQKRKQFLHHQDSVYDHSLRVSKTAYKISKKLSKYINISTKDVARGGLLHDFYTTPWRENHQKGLFKKHGFTHAQDACNNAYKYFPDLMNKKTENIIKRHMFPLNIIPPRYLESWIVTMVDKYISVEFITMQKDSPGFKRKYNKAYITICQLSLLFIIF